MRSNSKILSTKAILILAAVITGAVFVVTLLTSEMAFYTSDDYNIQMVLSGLFTGTPFPVQQYVNVVITFPIAGLYRLIPGVQWWYVWSMAEVAAGIYLVHVFVLKLASKNRIVFPVVLGILIFLDIGFYMYPIANISFTIVPGILGAGLVAGWYCLAHCDAAKYEKWLWIGTLVGYVLVYCHRRQTGIVILCFLLLACLYYFITQYQNRKQAALRILVTAGCLLLLSFALTRINRTVQAHYNSTEFYSFNSARSQFEDYPHDSYDENPDLYAEVGWDRDIYTLADHWSFLEEEVDAQSLSYVSGNSADATWADAMEMVRDLYHNDLDRSILKLFVASAILALYCLIVCRKKKNIFFLLLNNLGAIALLGYQILLGRMLYHTVMIVVLPAVVTNIMLSVNHKMEGRAARIVFVVLAAVLGVEGLSPMLETTFDQEHRATVAEKKAHDRLIRDYRAAHADNFYIVQGSSVESFLDPVYDGRKTANSYFWGGGIIYSAAFWECLSANGFSEWSADLLKEDRVYFISTTNAMDASYVDNGDNLFATLLRYLEDHCGALGFVMEDKITGGAYVYHFVFEDNAADYGVYYDIVDGVTVAAQPALPAGAAGTP